jgi:Tfp pilus assembly protein FimT
MKRRRLYRNQSGVTILELFVVIFIIAIVAVIGTPAFISYSQAARLKGGAQELATILNHARQVAITRNTTACVVRDEGVINVNGLNVFRTWVLFRLGGCGATAWTGAGSDASGRFMLTEAVRVSAVTPANTNVVFNHLGTANTAVTYTVLNPSDNRTMRVSVALSGRITVVP